VPGSRYSVADAAELLAKELRESVDSAYAKAAIEALSTYKMAGRLALRRETARLRPVVEMMRRTLGRAGTRKPAANKPGPAPVPETPDTTAEAA
jgi:hypothetical protein